MNDLRFKDGGGLRSARAHAYHVVMVRACLTASPTTCLAACPFPAHSPARARLPTLGWLLASSLAACPISSHQPVNRLVCTPIQCGNAYSCVRVPTAAQVDSEDQVDGMVATQDVCSASALSPPPFTYSYPYTFFDQYRIIKGELLVNFALCLLVGARASPPPSSSSTHFSLQLTLPFPRSAPPRTPKLPPRRSTQTQRARPCSRR